ncbi:MAG TPA: histidine kinase dimerization/phosphoacceptor domain -containing protein, partial [Ignavibacteria bacterium]|nr:histidine kinase dimerization/phosphoacceptor domain -containing protein [Ignavibacteria bacterium]
MSCDSMLISSFDAKTQMISIVSAWADGEKPEVALFKPLPLAPEGFGIQSTVIRSGESKLILNYNEQYTKTINRYTLSTAEPQNRKMYASALVVPLKMDEDVIGVIQVLSYTENAYNENDLRILESLAGSITAATLNASLYQRAQTEIAERINKENEISEIRENLEEAQRIAHIGSWMYNSEDNRIYNSGEIYRILGIIQDSDNFSFEEAMSYIHPEDRERTKARLLKAIEQKSHYTNEDRIVRPNGEVRYMKIVGEPIIDHRGNVKGVQGTLQDITDIKLINDELLRSLGEKELMLKEIHHRVKNNLQVVSSLLRLQSETISDESAIGYLKMSEQRVRSMALIHQQLYRTKDLTRIDFRQYLEELCNYLFFANDVRRDEISLNLRVDEIYFAIDTALPCGLIVNELVTNSLKHAFRKVKKG